MRHLVSLPCQDACGELSTGRTVEGAPVYLCPGCDSQWYDDSERTSPPEPEGKPGDTGTPATQGA